MGLWGSTPRKDPAVIVAKWRHSQKMTPASRCISLLSLVIKLAWPTWFVNLTVLAQVSNFTIVYNTYFIVGILGIQYIINSKQCCVYVHIHKKVKLIYFRGQQEGNCGGRYHYWNSTNGLRWCGRLHWDSTWTACSANCVGWAHVRGLSQTLLQELVRINFKLPYVWYVL